MQSGNNIGAAVTQVQNALSQVSVQRVVYGKALQADQQQRGLLESGQSESERAGEFSGWRGSRSGRDEPGGITDRESREPDGDEPHLELAAPTGFPHVTREILKLQALIEITKR